MKTANAVERSITLRDAAKILGIHPNTCQQLTKRGKIPAQRIGRQWRYLASVLNEWRRLECSAPLASRPKEQEEETR